MTPEEGRVRLEINNALMKLAHKHGALVVASVARSYCDYIQGQQAIMDRYDKVIADVDAAQTDGKGGRMSVRARRWCVCVPREQIRNGNDPNRCYRCTGTIRDDRQPVR